MLYRDLPAGRAGPAGQHPHVPTALAPALGPVLGGLLVTDAVLAVGLLRQPAHRHGRRRLRRACSWTSSARPRPGGSTWPGSCWPALGLGPGHVRRVRGPARAGARPLIWRTDRRRRGPAGRHGLRRAARSTSPWSTFGCSRPAVPGRQPGGPGLASPPSSASSTWSRSSTRTAGVCPRCSRACRTFPEAIGVMVGAQVVSRLLYPAFGPRRLMAVGPASGSPLSPR